MAVDPLNLTTEVAVTLISEVGRIGLWLQALGVFVVIWIGVQVFNLYNIHRRRSSLVYIKNDLRRIERKLDKVLKK